jgi:thiamine pyrophosphokinase
MRIQVREQDDDICCLLLNNLDGVNRQTFLKSWKRGKINICADGAFSLLKKLAIEFKIDFVSLYPHFVVGDLDSINPSELMDFESRGGCIIKDSSQDATDFEKCIRVYRANAVDVSPDSWLLVFGAMGGPRLDHTLACFHHLFAFHDIRVKLMQDHAIAFVIPQGDNELLIDNRLEGTKCGLFPVAGPCKITTAGLKWNLDDSYLQYGKLVSVSNEIVGAMLKISCECPILFTIQTGILQE